MNYYLDQAVLKRTCECGIELPKGSIHLAYSVPTRYGEKRKNLCRKCALERIQKDIVQLMELEKKVKTEL